MILEALITTRNPDRSINISPMGPTITPNDEGTIEQFELRPFNTSTTFANLKQNRCGVLHVTDDVEMIARTAIGTLESLPKMVDTETVDCQAIAGACRWYEFTVEFIDETEARVNLNCRSVRMHRNRDFFGFNRAKHAVLEAAILATRIDFLPADEIAQQYQRLATIVKKTGGMSEANAFDLLQQYVNSSTPNA